MSKLALGTKSAATVIRALQFAIAALILGIFSYYLASQYRQYRMRLLVLTFSQRYPAVREGLQYQHGRRQWKAYQGLPLFTRRSP